MLEKVFRLDTLLCLALVLALGASLSHVAYAFSTVNGQNWTEAYISAIAIDLGMLALAAGINKRKGEKRATWPLWLGVIVFSIISTYANWLAGITHVGPVESSSLGRFGVWLVSLRPILLSAALPVLVIYLSEVVSGNYQSHLTEAHRQAKKSSKENIQAGSGSQLLATLALARETKQANIEVRRNEVAALIGSGKSYRQIAGELGVGLATVKRDAKALNGRGHYEG